MNLSDQLKSALAEGSTRRDVLERLLAPYGQQHLVTFWDQLDTTQREVLSDQIAAIDFDLLVRLHRQESQSDDWSALAARAESPPAFRLDGSGNRFTADEARRAGEQALRAGQVGVILVAGGQGTRLGFDHPKGMYAIGPVSDATLFQILCEKVLAVARRYEVSVPLLVMTSPATHAETVAFLDQHDRFGLPDADVRIFCQGTMPAVDAETGCVLLSASGEIFTSPDGHGGLLAALGTSGALADVRRRGIEHLFYMQVDNPLVRCCDPEFVGYHVLSRSELSTQVIAKRAPDERVGNVAMIDGQVRIIEYSDLPTEAAERRNADGSLTLWAGNTAIHVFDVNFLERVAGEQDGGLEFHQARKAVPFVDSAGRRVEPTAPNAIKFERFIFDMLPAARTAIVMEVDPADSFAPVKNAPGDRRDTPEQAQQQMSTLFRSWLLAAGAEVAADVAIEISPLFALDRRQVQDRVKRGERFDRATYLK